MGNSSRGFVPIDSDVRSVGHAKSSFNEKPIVCRTMLVLFTPIARLKALARMR
jgi:hypothetical protein